MARQQIDARTKTMSAAALACRRLGGHAMTPVPVATARRLELRQLGQYAERLVCLRGCSRWREDVFDGQTHELVARRGSYLDKDSYLVQGGGGGRLPQAAARAAYRKMVGEPELVPGVPLPEEWAEPVRRSRPAAVTPPPAVAEPPKQRVPGRRKTAATR